MYGGNYTVYFTYHTENWIRFNLTHRIWKLGLNETFWASIFFCYSQWPSNSSLIAIHNLNPTCSNQQQASQYFYLFPHIKIRLMGVWMLRQAINHFMSSTLYLKTICWHHKRPISISYTVKCKLRLDLISSLSKTHFTECMQDATDTFSRTTFTFLLGKYIESSDWFLICQQ